MKAKIIANGLVFDLSFIMATNAWANIVAPASLPQYSDTLQILAGTSGILLCLGRFIKMLAEAYAIKKAADKDDSV